MLNCLGRSGKWLAKLALRVETIRIPFQEPGGESVRLWHGLATVWGREALAQQRPAIEVSLVHRSAEG